MYVYIFIYIYVNIYLHQSSLSLSLSLSLFFFSLYIYIFHSLTFLRARARPRARSLTLFLSLSLSLAYTNAQQRVWVTDQWGGDMSGDILHFMGAGVPVQQVQLLSPHIRRTHTPQPQDTPQPQHHRESLRAHVAGVVVVWGGWGLEEGWWEEEE